MKENTVSDVIEIGITIQIEKISDQLVRARALRPWRVQAVDRSWKLLRPTMIRKLQKAIRHALPTNWLLGSLPADYVRSQISTTLPPSVRSPQWEQPVEVVLEVFRWQLNEEQCVVKIPAVNCSLFGKNKELTDEEVAKQARSALLRTTEELSIWQLQSRVGLRGFDYQNLTITASQERTDDDQVSKRKRKQTATLRTVASNLNRARLEKVYGMDQRATELAEYFVGESPQSVLLVGPSGVGKTSLVHQLVQKHAELGLSGRTFWSTSGARIVSGMSGLGMWQERCTKLIREAHQTNAIVHLGSLFELMEAGKIDGQPGVSSMIRQAAARGKLVAIAECTTEQLAIIEREDPILLRAFQRFELKEAEPKQVVSVLQQAGYDRANDASRFLQSTADNPNPRISFTDEAIEELHRLHARYATYSALPALPLRLMQSMLEQVNQATQFRPAEIARAFSKQTGLPEFLVNELVPINLPAIERQLSSHVIGQQEPIDLIVNLLATLKARMVRPGRPLASLLFIGPTGVGKTEMAKALAHVLYSDTHRMIRIDMSEYATPWSAVKLIGRVGEGDGTLTSPIREQPFSVVLLDEFEKADPTVFDMLLQLLGEGRLTDSRGRLADFRNAVVIMTSNLGVENFKNSFGFADSDVADWRAHFEREVQRFVRPEFLGRIDRIVPFRPLPREVVRQIALRELDILTQRSGLKYRDAQVEFTSEAIDRLCELGYEPKYGARPLRRAIEKHVAVPLADKLASSSSEHRWKYTVQADGDKIRIDSTRLQASSRDLKDQQAEVINDWQELGRMAQLARVCAPLRDLENETDRLKRQNKVLEQKVKVVHGPSRVAALRDQLMLGQAAVDQNEQLRNQLFSITDSVQKEHLQLLVEWYRNQRLPWTELAKEQTKYRSGLRQAVENVLQGRATTSNHCTLLVVCRHSQPLEILWRAYHQLALECHWSSLELVLRPYDPAKEKVTDPAIEIPATRLMSSSEENRENTKLCDAYAYSNPEQFQRELGNSLGFLMQLRGEGVSSWFEDEHGIFHFIDSRAGNKKRIRARVSVYDFTYHNLLLPLNWLEPIAEPDRDPRRTFFMSTQTIQDRNLEDVPWAQGKAHEALLQILRTSHENALWRAIAFEEIPIEAKIDSHDRIF